MSFIDWSDPECLFDMLVEFVADAKNEFHGDSRRQQFLAPLLSELTRVKEQYPMEDVSGALVHLRRIYDSIDREFLEDPVVTHISACIEELERIKEI